MIKSAKLVTTTTLLGTSVAGTSVGITYYLNNKPISFQEKLKNEKKRLMPTNNNDSFWRIKLNTYKTRKNKTNSLIQLSEETIDKLKEACKNKDNIQFNSKNNKLYEEVKELCTFPTNKEQILNSNKFVLIESKEAWENKVNDYKLHGTGDNAISELTNPSATDLENWCKTALEEEYIENGTEDSLVSKWCSNLKSLSGGH